MTAPVAGPHFRGGRFAVASEPIATRHSSALNETTSVICGQH
jgi:hypothetical protein